jgi:hypothetical protein
MVKRQNRIKALKKEKKDLEKKIVATRRLLSQLVRKLKTKVDAISGLEKPEVKVPAEYNASGKLRNKILYILSDQEGLTLPEIVSEIQRREKTPATLYAAVQRLLIRMIDELVIIKIGEYRSKYKLNIK